MSGGDLSGIERARRIAAAGSFGSRASCSTATRVHGGGTTWPLPATPAAPMSQLWWGRQVHATRTFVWSQLLLVSLAALLLITVATGAIDPNRWDWLSHGSVVGAKVPAYEKGDNVRSGVDSATTASTVDNRTTTTPPQVPSRSRRSFVSDAAAAVYLERKRTLAAVAAGIAYFYLISVVLAWLGVQTAEARGRREEENEECRATASTRDVSCCSRLFARMDNTCLRRATACLLLAPWLLSVTSLLLPLLLVTLRLAMEPCYYVYDTATTYVLYEVWFKYVPLLVLWILSLYGLFGCGLAFAFTWRRADGRFGGAAYGTYGRYSRCGGIGSMHRNVPLRESAAAASFSWTFRSTKDRNRITNKDGDLNKSMYSVTSNKSYKSTRNPTLRGYTKKTDDLDVSLLSEENYGGGDSMERNVNNKAHNRRLTPSEQMRTSRGFSGYAGSGVSRAPLEPVEEEEYSGTPEKTVENGDLRM